VRSQVETVTAAVGDSRGGALAVLPALALGLLAFAVAVPVVRPRSALAMRQAEIAGLALSCLVAWALVALL
jgi:cytochrome c biogenesis factor